MRPDVLDRLGRADKLIEQRMGDLEALGELTEGVATTFKDQFLQTHFDPEREEAVVNDSYVVLAVYRSLRDALDRFILDQIALRRMGLAPEEIEHYLRRRGSPQQRKSAA